MAEATKEPLFRLSEEITEEDIPIMAAIGHESFLNDTHTNLKTFFIPEKAGPDDGGIRDWLKSPQTCHPIKAVSTATNEIMGFICWVHRGYVPRKPKPEATRGRFSDESAEDKPRTKIQIMEDMEESHFVDFMTEIMPDGTKCWFIAGLTVAPKFQGQGVGRALLNWGTSRAEKDNVFAWVHSSDSAWKAYAACGFEPVRVLRVDLDAYAEGEAVNAGPGEGGKWGIYTIRYMAYKPERIGANGWKVIKNVEEIPLS